MKKTKQKTKKKITTKSAFIYGLIGGFSIFAIFLIIVVLIGYASIPKTQSVNAENQSHNYPMEVQRALPPPASYDYAVMPLWSQDLDDFAWGSSYYYDTQEGKLDDYIHFDFISATDTYLADTILFQAQQGYVSATMAFQLPTSDFNYSYTNNDYYAGLGAIGSDDIYASSTRWQIVFENTSNRDYAVYFDISSVGSSHGGIYAVYYNDLNSSVSVLTQHLSFFYNSLTANSIRLSASSKITVYAYATSAPRFLDSIYIKDLGVNTAYGVGFDDGFDDGYDDGYDFGFNEGFNEGYTSGLNDYASEGVFPPLAQSFNLIRKALGGALDILALEVMPGVSIFGLLLVPFVISLFWVVIKFLRG